MKLTALSASRIKTFEQCPLKYWAVYEEEMTEIPHPLTLLGSSVHKMFEEATKRRMKARDEQRDDPVSPLVFKDDACKEFKVQAEHLPLIDELVKNGEQWGYFRNIKRTVGCELEFSFALSDGTIVRGFIDRLDVNTPNADVLDLKTQKNAFEDNELSRNWQAQIYNCGARHLYPEIQGDVSVSFWVLRHQVQRVYLKQEDAENTKRELVVVADKIRSCVSPEAKPSGLCPFCPYYDKCSSAHEGIKARFKRKSR